MAFEPPNALIDWPADTRPLGESPTHDSNKKAGDKINVMHPPTTGKAVKLFI